MVKILGVRFKLARQASGLSIEDVAKEATLSKKQIYEIENGGQHAFYSAAIKLLAAKKVANILGLRHEDSFELCEIIHLESGPQDLRQDIKILPQNAGMPLPALILPRDNAVKHVMANPVLWSGLCVALLLVLVGLLFIPSIVIESLIFAPQDLDAPSEIKQEAPSPLKNSSAGVECTKSLEAILGYTPPKATKAGDQVYVLNKSEDQAICFEDANGNQRQMTISTNGGFNFVGKPPLKIVATALSQFDIYYQGYKVRSDLLGQAILLEERRFIKAPL